ncbi:hypothetical protein BBJ28_00020219 [Nothophytophthora sp. Chile5]|nr:hypothetical protein BBJ28_00020219 [Nothophytophthora sp. Chile5]
MAPPWKVSCVNHAALVNDYYAGHLCLRKDSLQIPACAFLRSQSAPSTVSPPVELSATAARRKRKRDAAARRRAKHLEELSVQGKFVPLDAQVRRSLQAAHERFGGPRLELREFLPCFRDDGVDTADTGLRAALGALPMAPEGETFADGNVHCNATDHLQIAAVDASGGGSVVLPAGACFALRDVRELHQLPLGKHQLIVLDPPWENKSVARAKRYATFHHTELLKIDVRHIADEQECILAVWVTNRPRYMAFLREQVLPAWGFTYHACWYWLKLCTNGELVTPLDSTHRLPVETLVVAYRAKDPEREQRVRKRLGEQTRAVLSIPLRHSWKPPPECFFGEEEVASPTYRKAELFARELRPHWTSVGNEVRPLCSCY